MKKFITSFAIAASMLCGTASAQGVPAQYNYQGVCKHQNQTVEVVFEIKNKVTGEVVYSEVQDTKTTKDGLFNTTVGGKDGWNEIDWAGGPYQLHVIVEGNEGASCDLNAVPYATMAQGYIGQQYIEEDLQNLIEEVGRNVVKVSQYEADKAIIDNQLENAYLSGQVAQTAYDMADKNTDAIDVIEQTLVEIVPVVKGNTGAIASLTEGLEQTTNLAQSLSEDLYKEDGIVDTVIAQGEHIDALQAQADENEKILLETTTLAHTTSKTLQAHLTEAQNVNIANAEKFANHSEILDIVTSDVQGIQEALRGKANVDEVAAIENLAQSLSEDLYKDGGLVETVIANVEAIANVTDDVQGISEAMRDMAKVSEVNPVLEGLQEAVELLYSEEDGPIAALQTITTQLDAVTRGQAEEIAANAEAIEIVSSDLQGVVESLRGKATVEAVAELDKQINDEEGLAALLQKNVDATNSAYTQTKVLGNEVAGLKLDIINLNTNKADKEAVDVISEGLNATQDDVRELVQDNMSNKAAIAEVTLNANTALEQVNYLGTYVTDEENPESVFNQLQTLNEGLSTTQDDVRELVEDNIANKAAIAGLQALELPNVVENLEGLVPVIEDLVENKIDAAEYNNIKENLEGLVPFVNTLDENVDALQTAVAALPTTEITDALASKVELSNAIHLLEQRISTLTDAVNALDDRITKLEKASATTTEPTTGEIN